MVSNFILALGSFVVGLLLWIVLGTVLAAVLVLVIALVLIPFALIIGLLALPTIILVLLL
jgi:hypothetical protein